MKKDDISNKLVDLILWPLRLRSYIQDIEEINEKELSSEDLVQRIFNGKSLTETDASPEIQEINRIQIQFKKSINRIFEMKKRGQIENARKELKKIDPLTKKMVYLLHQIKDK